MVPVGSVVAYRFDSSRAPVFQGDVVGFARAHENVAFLEVVEADPPQQQSSARDSASAGRLPGSRRERDGTVGQRRR